MNDREKTVCFTGHRELYEPRTDIESRLEAAVRNCIARGSSTFIAGGAIGFDTIAAELILRLRSDEFPQIKLLLALPCPPEQQTAKWNDQQKKIYYNIYKQANSVRLVSPAYTRGCMYARNRFMVDNSSSIITYLRKGSGGTFYTYNYAKSIGIELIEL